MVPPKKPAVVTIMGHVDHGKTTLLDFIRKTKLATKEFGEITQAIGAYQIKFGQEKITFIDTPGHEAFSKMRRRGAKIADLVVLVVSAVDGVMSQTKECLKAIEQAQVPFIVAINKIDLPGASIDKIKTQLAENGILVEGYGGKVVTVPLSAKTGEGVDQLLEMILLTAEMLELKADPDGDLEAEVIETKADKNCGPMGTLIIKNGTLEKNAEIQVEGTRAKVKMLRNEWGKTIEQALPGDPVQVLGFSVLPPVGACITRIDQTKENLSRQEKRIHFLIKEEKAAEGKLKIILKTDVFGSLEAILGSLPKEVCVLENSVGEINESDILLAKTLGAEIYAFNLPCSPNILKLAQTEKVKIKSFRVIYDLLKDIEERILKIMEPTIDRKVLGKAQIIAVFEIKGERIAGARVVEGKINKNFPVCLQRGSEVLAETKIISLKQQKQVISEALVGVEFGAVFGRPVDFKEGDVIISYSPEEK